MNETAKIKEFKLKLDTIDKTPDWKGMKQLYQYHIKNLEKSLEERDK